MPMNVIEEILPGFADPDAGNPDLCFKIMFFCCSLID